MRIHIKSKQDLNKVTHSVRASQAVLQYGVGAMVDFQDQTLVTAAPEYWTKTQRIFDDRFAKALNVDYFATPVNISGESSTIRTSSVAVRPKMSLALAVS